MNVQGRNLVKMTFIVFVALILVLFFNMRSNYNSDTKVTENAPSNGKFKSSSEDGNEGRSVDVEINSLLNTMSQSEKIGQLFFCSKGDDEFARYAIEKLHVGGLIFYSKYFEDRDPDRVSKNIKEYQEITKIPLLIGVDEEGGDVVRFSNYLQYQQEGKGGFKSPKEVWESGLSNVNKDCSDKGKMLAQMRLNVIFGPVCDVTNDENAFMYKRSLGQSATSTGEYVKIFIDNMNKTGISSVMKHFPGYGNCRKNAANNKMVLSTRSKEDFEKNEFKVFKKGIDSGVRCIMMSHIIAKCFDNEKPASLSANTNKVLREELNYKNVIVTDSMDLEDIVEYSGGNTSKAVVDAIVAGNDMIISSSKDIQEHIEAVKVAIRDGVIDEDRLDESLKRIFEWKHYATSGLIKKD